MNDSSTHEVAWFKIESRHELVTIGGVYRSPRCFVEDFVHNHICNWSKTDCCLLVRYFNVPHINRIKPTISGGCFDGKLLSNIHLETDKYRLRIQLIIAGPCSHMSPWWYLWHSMPTLTRKVIEFHCKLGSWNILYSIFRLSNSSYWDHCSSHGQRVFYHIALHRLIRKPEIYWGVGETSRTSSC